MKQLNLAKPLAAALVVSLALSPFVTPAQAADKETKPATITVSGTGKAAVVPDLAIINVGVMREGKTAREALTENTKAMAEVLEAMKAEGIEERDLQTSNFNIQPRYYYPPRKSNGEQKPPQITGYIVSNNLTVRIRDLTKTGDILDKAVTLGVNNTGGIVFTTDDPKSALKEARKRAVAEALDKAKTLTEGLGVSLGRVTGISERGNQPRPFNIQKQARMAESAIAADAAPVPVQAGENEYRVSVNVTWELEQ